MNQNVFFDYDVKEHVAIIQTDSSFYNETWFQQLIRLLNDKTNEVVSNPSGLIKAPWWAFLSTRKEIGAILKSSKIKYTVSDFANTHILKSKMHEDTYTKLLPCQELTFEEIENKLISNGWDWTLRPLTSHQFRNIQKIIKYYASATFSVPGAGKTTEALAYFYLKSNHNSKLLVVCPKNAFISWDEQLSICIKNTEEIFIRLRGGSDNIEQLFNSPNRFYIITYQQFARVPDIIANYLYENDTFVFLDESHRIKSGRGKITADSILKISHLPIGKLVMSGTPMPQSSDDLIPQYEFLYPEIKVSSENVIERIQPIFVRTTKEELNLPVVKRYKIDIPFNPVQKQLYTLMKYEVARQAEHTLSASTRSAFRQLGKSVIRLIEVVSNPSLLLKDLTFLDHSLLSEVLNEGSSQKLLFACERARQLAKNNKKCIIWTTFRENVETIAERLSDLQAVYIHGGIDTGDDFDESTREGRIKKFKEDDNCFVLVANPAAASESISLHMACHHAIYVDRTYNAAHYLQSEDRIHRLGLKPDQSPTIEILICPESIDENIQDRLQIKVERMANALNDKSLTIETIPYDIGDDPEQESSDIDYDDVKSLLSWLRNK